MPGLVSNAFIAAMISASTSEFSALSAFGRFKRDEADLAARFDDNRFIGHPGNFLYLLVTSGLHRASFESISYRKLAGGAKECRPAALHDAADHVRRSQAYGRASPSRS